MLESLFSFISNDLLAHSDNWNVLLYLEEFLDEIVNQLLVIPFFSESFHLEPLCLSFMTVLRSKEAKSKEEITGKRVAEDFWRRDSLIIISLYDSFCRLFIDYWCQLEDKRKTELILHEVIHFEKLYYLPYSSFCQSATALSVFEEFSVFVMYRCSTTKLLGNIFHPPQLQKEFFSSSFKDIPIELLRDYHRLNLIEYMQECGLSEICIRWLLLIYEDWYLERKFMIVDTLSDIVQTLFLLFQVKENHKWRNYVANIPHKTIFLIAFIHTWKLVPYDSYETNDNTFQECKTVFSHIIRFYKSRDDLFPEVWL